MTDRKLTEKEKFTEQTDIHDVKSLKLSIREKYIGDVNTGTPETTDLRKTDTLRPQKYQSAHRTILCDNDKPNHCSI